MRRPFVIVLRLVLLAGVVVAVLRLWRRSRAADRVDAVEVVDGWPAVREPWAPPPAADQAVVAHANGHNGTDAAWVSPDGAACPLTHPVKVKLRSGLFHLPGMVAYERTNPDRCYVDESSATAEGFTRAKR